MNKFQDNRINHYDLISKKFKHPIPIVYVSPLLENNETCVFVFCCGLGGTNAFNIYMNNPIYDNHYFVLYDKMGHGGNNNIPSQFKKKYIVELDEVVNWVKNKFPNKRIYLLGESWGSALNFLYYKKHFDKVAGTINWNMPTKPISPVKKKASENFQYAWRELLTISTNKNIKLPYDNRQNEFLTRDKMVIRAMALRPNTTNTTRLTLAVWRCMKPSYKFLCKNSKNPKYNFLYIQTGEDVLMCNKHINKIEQNADSNHYLKIPTGYHILTTEPKETKILYDTISNFIKRK